jgi:hypothetical protein
MPLCVTGFTEMAEVAATIRPTDCDRGRFPRFGLCFFAIGDREQHITMARSGGFTPANQILAFQLPANIVDRER